MGLHYVPSRRSVGHWNSYLLCIQDLEKRKLNKMVLESREKGLTRNWGVRVNRTPLDTKIGEVGDPGIHTATRGSIDEKGDA